MAVIAAAALWAVVYYAFNGPESSTRIVVGTMAFFPAAFCTAVGIGQILS